MTVLQPRVSVIVPCYNYGHLLSETLENLLQQSYSSWECIIVDDGSTDNTSEVANNFTAKDSRYNYVYQNNAGLSAARNTGISRAKGEFIQFLDADDLLSPNKFFCQLSIFDLEAGLDIVYSEVRYFHSKSPDTLRYTMEGDDKAWMKGIDSSEQQTLKEILVKENIAAVNCFLIKKTVFDKIGNFNTELKSVEDWEFWFRSAFQGIKFKFHNDPDSYALVRLHDNSMSRSPKGMMSAASIARLTLEKLIKNDKQLGRKKLLETQNLNELAYLHHSLYKIYKEEGDKKKASYHLFNYSKLKNEYKFLIKERIRLLIK